MTTYRPERAIILCRISDGDEDDLGGIQAQEADGRALAERLGWTVWRVAVEHRVSGYKRKSVDLPDGSRGMRVVRPEYRQILADLAERRADGLIAIDLDRATRDPRDLEDLIDVIEASSPRIPVTSVTGSLRLDTDADITMARIMVALANKSSRDTARRVARGRLRQAEEGRHGGGGRRFGRELDMSIRDDEAAQIIQGIADILSGVSGRQAYRRVVASGVPTVTGAPWTQTAWRAILLAPHVAGLTSHRGEIIAEAEYPAIIERERWEAARAILLDPSRTVTRGGPIPTRLGVGLYVAACGGRIGARPGRMRGTSYRRPTYHCRDDGCVSRSQEHVDDVVFAVAGARLARADAADLIQPASAAEVDARTVLADIRAHEGRLEELMDDYLADAITREQLQRATAATRARIAEARVRLAEAERIDPLAALAGNPDAEQVLRGLDLGRQRAIVAGLMTVTLLRIGTQRPPAEVAEGLSIEWTPSGPLGKWG